MNIFSKSSELLIRNWDSVMDVITARGNLSNELEQFLISIRRDLREQKWWSDQWVFEHHDSKQVYISRTLWEIEDGFLVWIGIEGFDASRIFGPDKPAQLYVWVLGNYADFAKELSRILSKSKVKAIGEVVTGYGGYVVKKPLRQYLKKELHDFEKQVRGDILAFFCYWAERLSKKDDIIIGYISEHAS